MRLCMYVLRSFRTARSILLCLLLSSLVSGGAAAAARCRFLEVPMPAYRSVPYIPNPGAEAQYVFVVLDLFVVPPGAVTTHKKNNYRWVRKHSPTPYHA